MIDCHAWTDRLAAELLRAETSDDPEAVHKLRVAAGRLSVALELARRRALRDDLHALRRSAARMRDLDVWSVRATAPAFAQWLADERAVEHARWVAGRDRARTDALLAALATLPPIECSAATNGIARLRKRAAKAGRGLERADAHAWHGLRRRLRRLRYALDWVDGESKAVEALQEELGELNNLAVGRSLLEACPVHEISRDEERALNEAYEAQRVRALAAWRTHRAHVEEH